MARRKSWVARANGSTAAARAAMLLSTNRAVAALERRARKYHSHPEATRPPAPARNMNGKAMRVLWLSERTRNTRLTSRTSPLMTAS